MLKYLFSVISQSKMTSTSVFLCAQHKDIEFTVREVKKAKIFTVKKLEFKLFSFEY